MNYNWDLDVLYTSTDSAEFKADVKKLEEQIKELNTFASSITHDDERATLKEFMKLIIDYSKQITNLFTYVELNMSIDSTNSTYASVAGVLSQKQSETARSYAIFEHYIADIEDLDTVIGDDAFLKEHEYMLKKTKENAKHMLSEDVEEVISKLSSNSTEAWGNLQDFLTSTVEVPYRDEVLTLPAVRNLAYSEDASERKDAYEAELKCYEGIKESVAFSLNSIKGTVNTISSLRGYESGLDQALADDHMSRKTLDAMFEAVDEYLPKLHAYLRRKGELLGYSNGLPWYEMFAPMGKSSSSKFTVEESKEYLLNQFKNFSKDMCDMISEAYDNRWIDFYPKKGKSGGAFCAEVPSIKQSRILTNFDGSLSDVVTLAHELGHAYHNLHTWDLSPLNSNIPMQLAETASTFNETVVMNAAIKNAKDKDEKLRLIESQLSDTAQIVCDIYSRYLFEREVFDRRHEEFMYAKDLEEIMLNAQKKAYGDGLDPNYLHPFMWVCKSHYYSTFSFYNFPYTFGSLFAHGLYAKYEKEGQAFIPGYQKLLNSTSLKECEDVAMMAGIDVTSKEFWCSSLESITELYDEFCELTK